MGANKVEHAFPKRMTDCDGREVQKLRAGDVTRLLDGDFNGRQPTTGRGAEQNKAPVLFIEAIHLGMLWGS